MKKIYVSIGVLVCVLVLVLIIMKDEQTTTNTYTGTSTTPTQGEQTSSVDQAVAVPEFGLSFSYAKGASAYTLVDQSDQERGDLVYASSLFDSEEYEAFLENNTAGESPVALHIAVYRNPMNLSAQEWIESTPESNFSLSTDGSSQMVSLGGTEYLNYAWDGLYRADAYVTSKAGYIYVFSNLWMDEDSQMRSDMREVIASVAIGEPSVPASVAHGDIRVDTPEVGGKVDSPIEITGQARGYWFFEASFPITLVDWNGVIIAQGYASAEGDWMTEEFVPFTAQIEYDASSVPDFNDRGALILKRDNPSGLPENDDAIEIPIEFN